MVRRIDRECYLPLLSMLRETGAPVTLNVCFSLTEQLDSLGSESLEILRGLHGVEFTATAAWHPLLPLIPRNETARQTAVNCLGNRRMIGPLFSPSGYFPPEMAFDGILGGILSSMGYLWTITDDLPWNWSGRDVPHDWIPGCRGMRVFLRSNFWSNRISFHGGPGREVADSLLAGMDEWCGEGDSYTVIAMDGETFGHHRKGGIESFLEPFLQELMESRSVELSTLGEISGIFPVREAEVPSGSWSTTVPDLEAGIPWPLWDHPENPDHEAMWELLRVVLDAARRCDSPRVADLADRMLYSCPFWWASNGRKNAEQVHRGVQAVMLTAQAVAEHTGTDEVTHRVAGIVDRIVLVTGEENRDAEERTDIRGETRT
jgi:hypothetical protein